MKKMKFKKGDTVILITGKERGKIGKILKVLPQQNKVAVENIAIVTKHQKKSQVNPNGGIVKFERPINVSNVAFFDTRTSSPSRIGYKMVDGVKKRYAKNSGEVIDV